MTAELTMTVGHLVGYAILVGALFYTSWRRIKLAKRLEQLEPRALRPIVLTLAHLTERRLKRHDRDGAHTRTDCRPLIEVGAMNLCDAIARREPAFEVRLDLEILLAACVDLATVLEEEDAQTSETVV